MQLLTVLTCSNGVPCVRLHNGGKLMFYNPAFMGGTSTTNAMLFYLDADGTYSGTTNGAGKALEIALYYNGQIRTHGSLTNPTTPGDAFSRVPDPNYDPPWFSW